MVERPLNWVSLVRGPGFKGCPASWTTPRDKGETPDPYPIAQVGATPSPRHLLTSDGGSIPDSQLLASRGEYTSLCVRAQAHHPDRGGMESIATESRSKIILTRMRYTAQSGDDTRGGGEI